MAADGKRSGRAEPGRLQDPVSEDIDMLLRTVEIDLAIDRLRALMEPVNAEEMRSNPGVEPRWNSNALAAAGFASPQACGYIVTVLQLGRHALAGDVDVRVTASGFASFLARKYTAMEGE